MRLNFIVVNTHIYFSAKETTMVEDKRETTEILKTEENPMKDEGENKQVRKIFRK